MRRSTLSVRFLVLALLLLSTQLAQSQTLAFPGAGGFGRYALGARGASNPQVYIVSSLADSGPGTFRDAVSTPGRIVVFAVGGIVTLSSDIVVAPNTTIAGQTAPGDGITFVGKRITFSGSSNTICRFLRIRLGATGNSGKDASGLANGANMIFDHMSFTWGMDEVFSINWDSKGTSPDNITVQNSIIGQGLHRDNHSAGGLIQTPDGGKVSLIRNLYISNKTRNPKVKGINEFVNNVVYNWGNGNRLADNLNYGWSGDGYIMGGSSGVSQVNVINNYFVGGPLTPPSVSTPFSRGTGTFNIYGAGNYFDNNKNGALDGNLVPYDSTGYPGITAAAFQASPFAYPAAGTGLSAQQAYQWIIDSVGPVYPRRDQLDSMLVDEVGSKGLRGFYVYRESDLPLANGGVGNVFNAPAPLDSDSDGMPDAWEDARGLNKLNASDAVAYSLTQPQYLNIEVYVNTLINTAPPPFIKPPTNLAGAPTSWELPSPGSQVVLNWTDNASNETHFVLERSLNGTSFTGISQPAANSNTYTDGGLVPNTTYYYRVKAVNAQGSSSYSTTITVKTPPLPTAPAAASAPSPANGFQYVELVAGKATLKWSGSSNTTSYAVYVGTTPANLTKRADVAYAAAPSYQVSGLNDFITYYWRIDATNSKGTTEGALWSFRTTKVFPAALAGYWAFDETGEGIEVTDSSSFENHGILGLDDDDQSIRVPGKVKGGISFATAATNMYVVSVPHEDQLYLDKSSFSLSFWMKAPASLLPQDNNTSAYLLCKGSITRNATTGATGKRFDIEFKNKQIRFAIDDDNDANGGGKDELQADGTPFFNNNWVHVVAIRDTASKKLRLYMNGSMVKEQTISKAFSGIGEASALVVGNIGALEFLTNTNAPAPYKGMLDELKIFNYVLSPSEVMEQFHTSPLPLQPYAAQPASGAALEGYGNTVALGWKGGLKTTHYKLYTGADASNLSFVADVPLNTPSYTIPAPAAMSDLYWRVDAVGPAGVTEGETWTLRAVTPKGLVGHWKLDETSGTLAADNSNYQHHGTVISMPEATWPAGKFGNGLLYKNPGTTGAVRVPHAEHLQFDQNAFSISMWVKLTNGNSNYNSAAPAKDCYLIQKGQFVDPGGKWYGIQLRDSTLTFAIDDAVTKTNVDVSLKKATANFIFNNNWTHIVAVKDTAAKLLRLFINGVQVGTKSNATNGTIGKALPLLIGNSIENKPFRDLMDDVRLYNYALSASEISSINQGSPLVAKATNPSPAHGATGVNYGSIPLSWSGSAQTYNLYWGSTPGSLTLKAAGLTNTSYQVTAVNLLQPWYWRVDAVRDGEVATGDVWQFTTTDLTAPTAIAKDITVNLNSSGTASITAAQLDNGSSDAFGISTMQLSQSNFNCAHIGVNNVTLTVTDQYGNVASAVGKVTIADNTAPQVITRNVTVTLVNGEALVQGADINNGSTDACGIRTVTLDKTRFTCTTLGAQTVQLTVTDINGNSSTGSATVTVTGSVPTPSINVSRTDNTFTGGTATTVFLGYGAQSLRLNATDATQGGLTQYLWSPATALSNASVANPLFTPTQPGEYTYTVTATNAYGCAASATVKLTVIDARCGNTGGNVRVCHKGTELCLGKAAAQAHLAHGCSMAGCTPAYTTAARTPMGDNASSVTVKNELELYPSPASTSCTISFGVVQKGHYRLELLNPQGQLLRVIDQGKEIGEGNYTRSISTSSLKQGLYYVKLVTAAGIQVKRLLVQRH